MGVPLITNEPTVSKGQRTVSRHVRISTYLRVSPDLTFLMMLKMEPVILSLVFDKIRDQY